MPEPSLQLFGQRKIGGSWIAQLTANESYQAWSSAIWCSESSTVARRQASRCQIRPGRRSRRPLRPSQSKIEPLATHVPRECFYERFGSFTNYLWYRDFLHHWQNDLGNMITLRSINHTSRDRLQDQLAVHESQVGRVMGPKVIRDVCFMGFDYYLRDGAAFGILFQANNNLLLGQNFNGQREQSRRQASRREARNGVDRRPRCLVSLDARRPAALVLRGRRRLPLDHHQPPTRRTLLCRAE